MTPTDLSSALNEVRTLYHRLLLVVGPATPARSEALRALAAEAGTRVLDLNTELSELLLPMSERDRTLNLLSCLQDLVEAVEADVVVIDNTEILFEPSLKHDPLRLLKGISRNRVAVATWSGSCIRETLTYAEPGHPEYRRYPEADVDIVEFGPGVHGKGTP